MNDIKRQSKMWKWKTYNGSGGWALELRDRYCLRCECDCGDSFNSKNERLARDGSPQRAKAGKHSQRMEIEADSSEPLQNNRKVNDCKVRNLLLHFVARIQMYLYSSCSHGHVASPTPGQPYPPSRSRPPQPSGSSDSGLGHHVDRADVNWGQAQDWRNLPCAGLLATQWNVKRPYSSTTATH